MILISKFEIKLKFVFVPNFYLPYEATRRIWGGNKKDYVFKLNISLYGMKQSRRQWNKCFDKFN